MNEAKDGRDGRKQGTGRGVDGQSTLLYTWRTRDLEDGFVSIEARLGGCERTTVLTAMAEIVSVHLKVIAESHEDGLISIDMVPALHM